MLPIEINGPMIGIFLKELVRRAMEEIQRQRFAFEATQKESYGGTMDDVFTSADTAAQEIFEKSIREGLPGVGIIGEEKLKVFCTLEGCDAYVTIDPLDGTKAFVRKQSHGVATMVALVIDGEIVSAWIGDVNTMEIFGYRPGSDKVHRLRELRAAENLAQIERDIPPGEQYILLRESPEDFPVTVGRAVRAFKKYHIDGGSIGTWFARLWKGEYGAAILDPGHETPWDSTPFIGISQKLGFVFLKPSGSLWEIYNPPAVTEVEVRDHHTMVIHRSLANGFIALE
tara:strand:- start:98 stop:952 length:855 start_codon:yes stop_codon:yes gene_type:complete